jgi:FSR family fosmidomycin resistance protein-like MFS transporter
MQRRLIALLASGHLWIDFCQGSIPALLPFFVSDLHISYAAAGGLIFAANISSSVLQPAFGHLADRRSAPWLMPFGLLLAGVCVAGSGFLTHYPALFLALVLAGIGSAIFHPEAARLTSFAAGDSRNAAMSLFTVGGNVGFAVGPLAVTALAVAFGLHGSGWLLLAPLFGGIALLTGMADFAALSKSHAVRIAAHPITGKDQWPPFLRLTGAVMVRSVIFFGLNTFIPLYWIRVLDSTTAAGGLALSLLMGAGAVGTLAGGWVADIIGHRRLLLWTYGLLGPLLGLLLLAHHAALASLLLIPAGLVLFAPFSVMVVLSHEYLPTRLGTASGVTFGLAITVGGLFAPVLGRLADHYGLPAMFLILAVLPVFAWLLSLSLPEHSQPKKEKLQPAAVIR